MSVPAAFPAGSAGPSVENERGFTLVELMVALSGGLFLSVVVFALARDTSRFYQREGRLATATLAGITGFERLKADIARASYLCTPNVKQDRMVRPLPTNSAEFSDLAGIRILPDTPDLQSNVAFDANRNAGQEIKPDQIELAGSYGATDEFPGSISTDGTVVTLAQNSPSLARLGVITAADDEAGKALVANVFTPGKILRFLEVGSGFQSYGQISTVEVTNGIPYITLAQGLLGIEGHAVGASVNVVNRIRYFITNVKASGDTNWAPLFTASDGAPGENARTELVREEFDGSGQRVGASLEIAAEYAVDLEFGVTGQAGLGADLTYVPSDSGQFVQFFDADTGRPQGVRSVRVRMSVRSREADRESNVSGMDGGVYRFKLGGSEGWARVRTFQADVQLQNQAGVTW
jgi:hypothetical protein